MIARRRQRRREAALFASEDTSFAGNVLGAVGSAYRYLTSPVKTASEEELVGESDGAEKKDKKKTKEGAADKKPKPDESKKDDESKNASDKADKDSLKDVSVPAPKNKSFKLPEFRKIKKGDEEKDFKVYLENFFGVIDEKINDQQPETIFRKKLVEAKKDFEKIVADSDAGKRTKPADSDEAELKVIEKVIESLADKVKECEQNAKGLDARQFFMSLLGVLLTATLIFAPLLASDKYRNFMFSNSQQRVYQKAGYELENGLKAYQKEAASSLLNAKTLENDEMAKIALEARSLP